MEKEYEENGDGGNGGDEIIMQSIQELDRNDKIGLLRKVHRAHSVMRGMEWPKDGYNTHQKYAYRTEGMMKRNFQEALLEAGLIYKLDIVDVKEMGAVGGFSTHMRATALLTLIDVDTGASLSYQGITEAGDSGDKAAAKLMTMALKSAISTQFAISSDDDPDDDSAKQYTPKADKEAALEELRRDNAAKEIAAKKRTVAEPKAAKAIPSPTNLVTGTMQLNTSDDGPVTPMQKKTMERMLAKLTEQGCGDIDDVKKSYDAVLAADRRTGAAEWIKTNRTMVQ